GAVAPASAGSISVMVTPQNAEQEQAMRMGLSMMALMKGMSEQGGISQNGSDNIAGVLQSGGGSQAVIIQEGDGHVGTIDQSGGDNACGLIQVGEETESHIVQNGGETCMAFQIGF
ncbi:curlin, partial [bacterium]|nr:curlin [bacterium]